MKKILAVALSFVLLFSCAFVGLRLTTADAQTPTDVYTVEVSVKEQGGYLGGAVSCDETQYITKGELATVSAVPFYGNGFIGWYDGDELVSGELSYSFAPTEDVALAAVFDVKNFVENGDAEVVSEQDALTDSINNAAVRYHTAYFGTASVIPTSELENTGDDYGDYALVLDPSQTTGTTAAAKVKNLANFSIPVKKNTDYIIRFSYKFDDNAAGFTPSGLNYALYMSLNGPDANGKIPYNDTDHTIKWAFHSQQDGTATDESSNWFKSVWAWGGSDGYDANAEGCDKYFTDNGLSSAAVWQDVYVIFNPGEDSDVFKNGENGTVFFSLGTNYNTTDFILVDNLLISEASANDKTTVSASKNGSVAGVSPRTEENYYTYTEGKRGDSDVYTNRDTTKLYYPTAYEKFTATEGNGAEFVGWFDEDGSCVSKANTAYLLMTGKQYTAKFATDITAEGGGYLADNGDGTYTAKAFYGNKFLGWYDGTSDPYVFKTAEPTLEKEGHLGYVAVFTNDNLIYDGDFEINANTADVYNGYTDYDATRAGTNSIVPTSISGSGPEFGEQSLQIVPFQSSHASKRKGMLNIPVELTQGETYLWKFSYAVVGNTYNANTDYLYLSVDPADGGKVPWTSDGGTKYSYHVQLASTEGVNTGNWAWGDYTSDDKLHYSTTKAVSDINVWVDVYVIFTADAAGTHFLTLGCDDGQTKSFLFDNMSLSAAQKNPTSLVSVTADANGKISSYRTDEAAYVTSAKRGTADIYQNYVDTANAYYADMYADYFAEPDVGFVFGGWYDANDQLVSSEASLRVKLISDEVYTAKFVADPNKYSASAAVETQNGVKGGYIDGESSYSQVGSGEKVTFTAVAYTGNKFLGWYNGDSLLTEDLTVEYTVRKDTALTAKFEINNLFADSGYENAAVTDSVLGEGLEWSSVAEGATASVIGNEVYSGRKAIMVTAPNIAIRHTAFTTDKNTPYYLSFMWKAAVDGETGLEYVKVLDENGTEVAAVDALTLATGEWQKLNLVLDSGEAETLTVEIKYTSDNSSLYFDDFIFCDASAVPFDITASVKPQNGIYGGYITGESTFKVNYGESVTVSAVPYEKNAFLGWYDGEDLLSTDATYTFEAYGFADIVARFEINNLWPDSGYENTEVDLSLSENGNWTASETLHAQYGFDVTVTDDGDIKDGGKMLQAVHRGNTFGTVISGLKENTNYFLTFSVRTHKTLDNCYFQHAKILGTADGAELGSGFGTANGGQWEDISVAFNSGSNTEVEIELLYQAGEGACYFDNFALFESNNIGIYAGDGGTVSSTLNGGENGPAVTGTSVTVTATPDEGNTFLGWYDYMDSSKLLSTANPYTFTVDGSQHIFAKFAGEGVESENYIVDGDFENGCFEGFIYSGSTATANCDFCTYQLTKKAGDITPVSGDYMIKLTANSRYTNLLVDNLKPHTDYTVSFYWLGNEYINFNWIAAYRYRAEFAYWLDQTTKTHQQNPMLRYNATDMRAKASEYVAQIGDGDGKNWRKVEFSFNTGNRSEVLLQMSYSRSGGQDGLYLDNFRMTEGSSYSDGIVNGTFDNSAAEKNWEGEYTVVDTDGNKAGVSSSVMTNGVNLEPYKGYTLSFKARSDSAAELIYGLAESGSRVLYENGRILSYTGASYDTAELTDEWQTYEVSFLATGYPQAHAVFQSLSGAEFMIDDVTFTRADELVPVQKLTFDSTELRYIANAAFQSILAPNAHLNPQNPDWFDYSTDSRTGDGSLLMKYNSEYVSHPLSQPWAELNLEAGRSYRVTFYAKASEAGTKFMSGVVYTDPSYNIEYAADETFTLDSTEWTEFTYTFTVGDITHAAVNKATFVVNGIENETTCDILFDDVLVEEYTNSVTDAKEDMLYTQDLSQNYFPNYSFEKDGDGFASFIKSGDASFGNRYITLKAGDRIIVPVSTRTDYNLARSCTYTFAADIRGNAQSKGTVGLSYSSDGKSLMTDAEGKEVTLDLDTAGKWLRQGFTFAGNRNETEYLVIECTAGTFDVDYLALFNTAHAFAENTHDTSVPLSKDEVEVSDMSALGTSNYITGNITGLPEGSRVILVGSSTYSAAITDGSYRIDGIKNGTYDMYVAAGGVDIMTLWGDLTVENGKLSGLAITRLEGEAVAVEGRGVSDGIVKITDGETDYSYLTATDAAGYYTAYILDCDWDIEGTTNDESALESYGVTIEQFGAIASSSDKTDIEDTQDTDGEEEEKTITKIMKTKGKKADNTLSIILIIAAAVLAVGAAAALLVLNRRKGVRD